MDTSGRTQYPVLFQVYGGPGSQKVDVRFQVDWHYYLASVLEYVVVVVDGRGTGFKGRKLRNAVKGNLGFFETRDQIAAARVWADKPYVDRKRIGIWGWVGFFFLVRSFASPHCKLDGQSYGGFMSSKVVEAAAGIHSLAMAVAVSLSRKGVLGAPGVLS
jgi:dipeptidyl aminopeptidase